MMIRKQRDCVDSPSQMDFRFCWLSQILVATSTSFRDQNLPCQRRFRIHRSRRPHQLSLPNQVCCFSSSCHRSLVHQMSHRTSLKPLNMNNWPPSSPIHLNSSSSTSSLNQMQLRPLLRLYRLIKVRSHVLLTRRQASCQYNRHQQPLLVLQL